MSLIDDIKNKEKHVWELDYVSTSDDEDNDSRRNPTDDEEEEKENEETKSVTDSESAKE